MSHLDKLLEQKSNDEVTVTFKLPETQRDRLTELVENKGIQRGQFIAAVVLDAMARLEA